MSFRRGQRVRVADRAHEGHHRTPGYVKGKIGVVERVHASFRNPEIRAYGADGLPEQTLYQVTFPQPDLWPGYEGPSRDRLSVDLFEHWLEDAS